MAIKKVYYNGSSKIIKALCKAVNDIIDGGGGGGSTVTITPTLQSGTKIADFSIDGVSDELYAPSGGGGGNSNLVGGTAPSPSLGNEHDAYYKINSAIAAVNYIRLSISEIRGNPQVYNVYTQLSEIRLKDASDNYYAWTGASIVCNKNVTSSSENADKLLDGSTATKCTVRHVPSAADPVVFDITLASAIDLSVYNVWEWYTANDANERDPVSWELYGSSDGVSWILLDSQTAYATTTTRQALAYSGSITAPSAAKITNKYLKIDGVWVEDKGDEADDIYYIIETVSTGGYDASVSVTKYINGVAVDSDTLLANDLVNTWEDYTNFKVGYGFNGYQWRLYVVSGVEEYADETIIDWSYSTIANYRLTTQSGGGSLQDVAITKDGQGNVSTTLTKADNGMTFENNKLMLNNELHMDRGDGTDSVVLHRSYTDQLNHTTTLINAGHTSMIEHKITSDAGGVNILEQLIFYALVNASSEIKFAIGSNTVSIPQGKSGTVALLDDIVDDASDISYDNTASGLVATDVQAAIDEVKAKLGDYLPLAGGTMTGAIKLTATAAAHNTKPSYLLTMDTFASGGEVKYTQCSEVTAGAASKIAGTKAAVGITAASGITLTNYSYKIGNIVTLSFMTDPFTGAATWSNKSIGTVASGSRPQSVMMGHVSNGSWIGLIRVDTNGKITAQTIAGGAVSSGYVAFNCCYVC